MVPERNEMPWARRLVVVATVFGMIAVPGSGFAQEDGEPTSTTESAEVDPAVDQPVDDGQQDDLGTAEEFVDALLGPEDPPAEDPVAGEADTDPTEGDVADESGPDDGGVEDVPDDESPSDAPEEEPLSSDEAPTESVQDEPATEDTSYHRDPIGRGNGNNNGNGGGEQYRQGSGGEPDGTDAAIASLIDSTISGGTGEAQSSAPVVEADGKSKGPDEGIVIDGGDVDNSTNVDGNAGGGDAAAGAGGGDDNAAIVTGSGSNGGSGSRIGPNGNRRKRPDLVWLARSGGARGGSGLGVAERAIAAVGNGGFATANANGGTIMMGPVFSGNNRGNTIIVQGPDGSAGCIDGPIVIDGGDVNNSTNINLDASGGTAIADASGGDGNTGIVEGSGNGGVTGSVGNGGDARANANGGTIMMGPIFSGGNEGNTIIVEGGACGGGNAGGGGKSGGGGKATKVTAMPETGSGTTDDLAAELAMLTAITAAAVASVTFRRSVA